MTTTGRRAIRRYAHELYPHTPEGTIRPLTVEVPYLYAQAIGLGINGTGWIDAPRDNQWAKHAITSRVLRLIDARHAALLADALLQGLTGDDAWMWAASRMDEEGESVFLRAKYHGVDAARVKPYPYGPEPEHHNHYGEPDKGGWRTVTRVDGRESDCVECTEPTDQEDKS